MSGGETIAARFAALAEDVDPAAIDGVAAAFAFDLPGAGGGGWTLRVADGRLAVAAGVDPEADVRVSATAADWRAIVDGDLDLQLAHRTGRLAVAGDMALAQRVRAILGF